MARAFARMSRLEWSVALGVRSHEGLTPSDAFVQHNVLWNVLSERSVETCCGTVIGSTISVNSLH